MPKNWQNEQLRRRWLLVAVWGIFALGLGIASVVGTVRAKALVVKLGEAKQVGPVRVQVPMGWTETDDSENALELVEPGEDESLARHVEIRVDHGSVMDVLTTLLRGNEGEPGKTLTSENIKLGEFPGKFKVQRYGIQGYGATRGYYFYDVIASAAIGNGKTLSISISFLGQERELAEPKELVKKMAASVQRVDVESPTTAPEK